MFVLPLARTTQRTAVAPSAHRVADHLFDTALDRIFGGVRSDVRTPALDVAETDDAYTLAFDVPGVTREQLNVSVLGRRVVVETVDAPKVDAEAAEAAEAAPAEPKAAPRVLYRERGVARYARTVSLPAEVDQATSQARFDNGVLTLTLAKKVPAGATRISVS